MEKLQVLLATMNQTDLSIVDKMNLRCSAVIANQADREEIRTEGHVKMITTGTRGVGLNRNIALLAADGDILLFAGIRFTVCGLLISAWAFANQRTAFAQAKKSVPSVLLVGLFAIILHYSFTYLGLSITEGSKTAILKQLCQISMPAENVHTQAFTAATALQAIRSLKLLYSHVRRLKILQQSLTTGYIIHKSLSLLPPGLITLEKQSDTIQCHSRLSVHPWIVCIDMEEKFIDT